MAGVTGHQKGACKSEAWLCLGRPWFGQIVYEIYLVSALNILWQCRTMVYQEVIICYDICIIFIVYCFIGLL